MCTFRARIWSSAAERIRIEVQATLPDRHHPGIVEELFDPRPCRRIEQVRVVGMHPRRGEDAGDRIGQLERSSRARGVHTHADQPIHACLPRSLDHE